MGGADRATPIDDRTLAGHWMLLRLAGTLPDDTLAQCRAWLVSGRFGAVARAVAFAARCARIPVSGGDVDLLAEFLELEGASMGALALLEVGETPLPPVDFAADAATARRSVAWLAQPVDDSGDGVRPPQPRPGPAIAPPADPVEHALVEVATRAPVRGVWRAWRYPADGSPWPPPRRLFVVEAEADADLPGIAAAGGAALLGVGAEAPLVEVYPVGADVPPYQHFARGAGALLWAVEPDPGVRVADVFDTVDPDAGGLIRPDHPRLDEPERQDTAGYLAAGEPLLVASQALDDVVEPGRGQVVPASFRTDGFWIWNDASTYYLDRYGLAPDPALLAHIRSRRHRPVRPDGAALHRAHAALRELLVGEGRP